MSLAWACGAGGAAGQAPAADDSRLSREAMDLLARACQDGNYAQAEAAARAQIFKRLAQGPLDRMGALTDMVYVLRACRYLAQADQIDPSRKLSAWLGANHTVSRQLFRAMQEVPQAEEANSLQKWQALLAADEQKVLAYVNLSVALATSRPHPHYIRQPAPASMVESFRWFTDANNAFRYDLKAMPMEMCRYLADTQLSLAERKWALSHFAGTANLPEVYFQVNYDMDYFFKGTPKKIAKVDYTLPNLLRYGGICVDQAYFASEVCKASGLPATVVSGHTASGEPHAWVACVKVHRQGNRTQAEWDANTARYEEEKFYTGTVVDPASGKRIQDSELMLLGASTSLPTDRREEADTATALAGLVAKALAGDPNELKPAGKIGPALVESLLIEAVNRNLAHRQVWELIVQLRKAGELSTDCLDKLFDYLIGQTARNYPDYSCEMVLRVVPTYEPLRREKIFQAAAGVYFGRPDLHGRVMIALGDDYAAQGKKDQALTTYKQVMGVHHELTEVLLTAARRAEDLLLAAKHRDQAIQMYWQLFSQAHKPADMAAADYPQSAYYQLGRRLCDLLGEDGQADAASKVRKKIGNSTRTVEGS